VAIVVAVVTARTAAFISSIALRTAPDAQLPWAISSARVVSRCSSAMVPAAASPPG
jgi:hypothetical protein